jgi:sugar O-acyltransferase (sialic acid O-acetyltransferase NeuD family)
MTPARKELASTDSRCSGESFFANAVGSDKSFRLRPAIVERVALPPERFATLVHPAAGVSKRARLGRGTCVNHGVSVGGGAAIGDHVYLGAGCVIGHDAVIEDHAVVAPAAIVSGFTRVGRNSYVGAGAIIKQTKQVGAGAVVGMGAVVCKDVPAGETWVGIPAGPYEPAQRGSSGAAQAAQNQRAGVRERVQ